MCVGIICAYGAILLLFYLRFCRFLLDENTSCKFSRRWCSTKNILPTEYQIGNYCWYGTTKRRNYLGINKSRAPFTAECNDYENDRRNKTEAKTKNMPNRVTTKNTTLLKLHRAARSNKTIVRPIWWMYVKRRRWHQ